MDLSDPASAVTPTLDAVVLSVVAGTTHPLTGRELERLARRGSHSGIQRVLTRMTEHGLLDVIVAGSSRLYSLNRDHVAAPAALALLDLRGQLFTRIRAALAEWPTPPVAAAVFGSAARGDGTTTSDIDVLLVRPSSADAEDETWADCVEALARAIRRWSGNPASIIETTPADITAMITRQEAIVAALRGEAIPLTDRRVLDVGGLDVGEEEGEASS
jgi:DNA-binding transcriptional ArsR family regulator